MDTNLVGFLQNHLVILAVVIIISLVVVALVTSSGSGQVTSVTNSSNSLSNSSKLISVSDTVVDNDGNGLITLQNNSGERLTITKINVEGKDLNYSSIMPQGDKKTFSLTELNSACSCTGAAGTKRQCDYSIYYQSEAGLEKRYDYTISVDCVSDAQSKNNSVQPTTNSAEPESLGTPYFVQSAGPYISGNGVVVDSSGNSYVVGSFYMETCFGSICLDVNNENQNIFVAKLGSDGNWLWAQQTNQTEFVSETASAYDIAIDLSGNIYVNGTFSVDSSGNGFCFGSTCLDSNSLEDSGASNVFVAKLDNAGEWLWAKKAEGIGYGLGISVDSSGNVYTAGMFSGQACFDSTCIETGGDFSTIYVAKLSTDGEWLWAKRADGPQPNITTISADLSGNSYVTGWIPEMESYCFDEICIDGSDEGYFVAKLDNAGNWIWVKKSGGDIYDAKNDSAGNLYVTGNFNGSFETYEACFDEICLTSYSQAIYVAKLSSDGDWLWAKSADVTLVEGYFYSYNIGVDSSGNSYVTGMIQGTGLYCFDEICFNVIGQRDAFVAKLSSDGGNWEWAKQAGDSTEVYDVTGNSISVDSSGSPYVTGRFQGNVLFGSTQLEPVEPTGGDLFVWKLMPDGTS